METAVVSERGAAVPFAEKMGMEGAKLARGGFAPVPARSPGETVDSIPHAPGVEKRQRKDPERRPERPVLTHVRQRELERPLRPNLFGKDPLPGDSQGARLPEEIFRRDLPGIGAHRPQREITRAVIAWLEGGFSARPREWSSSWMMSAAARPGSRCCFSRNWGEQM